MKAPEIRHERIYEGLFRDRNPDLEAAGKLGIRGEHTVLHCLKYPEEKAIDSDIINRFRGTFFPDPGVPRVFYGKANDPHRKWAEERKHGLVVPRVGNVKELVNPYPKTLLQQTIINKKEKIYNSHIKKPLETVPIANLPKHIKPYEDIFGIPSLKEESVRELVNPNKPYDVVQAESKVGQDLYRKTHYDFDPGEQLARNYTSPHFNPKAKFGYPTPHDITGRQGKLSLKWVQMLQDDKGARIVSKRADDFRERSQFKIGQTLDPIKDTMNAPHGYSFGNVHEPDSFGVGELIHLRNPMTFSFLKDPTKKQSLVTAVRQKLKKDNYLHFTDMVQAFQFLDTDLCGKLDFDNVLQICLQHKLPVEIPLLTQLIRFCDLDGDGKIYYRLFADILNWKLKMPQDFLFKKDKTKEQQEASAALEEEQQPGWQNDADEVERRIKKLIENYQTSASMINAVVGGVSTKDYRTYGVPTIRTDLRPPTLRRLHDKHNYGDEGEAFALVNHSVFAEKNVFEKDFMMPRTFEEIKDIFTNIGFLTSGENFERLYKAAAKKHPQGQVNVESFRILLDEIQGKNIDELVVN